MEGESKPAIVLDETCMNEQDLSKSLMCKVKELGSLSNLKVALANEGFENIKLKFMSGYWVLIEFESEVSKEKFKTHVGIGSWFSQIQQPSNEFHNDERVTWVDIEGIPLRVLGWIPDFVEEEEEDTDSDGDLKDDELDTDNVGPSVGNSCGILCLWDPRMFRKLNSTISDYFVMIRGEWIPNGKALLIISIYAPQELSEKKSLWEFLIMVIGNWNGEVIIMGDFNEVRNQAERYGSIFKIQGAVAFNSFISGAGLEEISLRGCSFTLCHKSATNMSKLDRFLISKNETNINDSNAMSRLLKKLRIIKEKIREWIKVKKDSSNNYKKTLKAELVDIDILLDKGEGNSDILNKRTTVYKAL
ncbi:RNA-directed DNA polymerase, eukaryota [Tanacetum coccineum]